MPPQSTKPLLTKEQLLETVVAAMRESGWNVLYLSDSHPFLLQMYRGDLSFRLLIYIWNITHGGGAARPADEYRIQVTGVGQFQQPTGTKTLILGWWTEGSVFAGFDVRKHSAPLGFSPSLQIRKHSLELAAESGFAPSDKGNQEIAIAFRPDFFAQYASDLEALHDFGQSSQDFAALEAVAQEPEVNTAELPLTNHERRVAVSSVSRKLRDVKFRRNVLTAYNYRCAFCGVQLNLTDAAHIVPVTHESSVDKTYNGLALCALHHRAYDQSLVTVWDDYAIRVSDAEETRLKAIARGAGIEAFREGLLRSILLPPVVSDRPHADYVRLGNNIRGWGF
jgi:putative restriction endonuclease